MNRKGAMLSDSWNLPVGTLQPNLFPQLEPLPELLAALLFVFTLMRQVPATPCSFLSVWTDGLAIFFLIAIGVRVLWNSAILVHGLGHCLLQGLVDQNPRILTLGSILENRPLADVVWSCLPFQPIVRPAADPAALPWVAVGDQTPWKVRYKAMGGLLFNGLAVAITLCALCHIPPLGIDLGLGAPIAGEDWLALAIAVFGGANALVLLCSVSDLEAIVSGQAHCFYCGNFGFIARVTVPEMHGLFPQRWVDLFRTMGRETEVRGEQAGGGLTIAQDWAGRSHFVGDKIVNAKRSNLTESLDKVFQGTRDRAWRAGFRPRYNTLMGVWHYRFGTSGPPAIQETHWHEWTPARLETVWQIQDNKWVPTTQNVNHRITHNGDFDGWQLFGQLADYRTLGLWLERVLQQPNQTVGDSAKIAGMMDLLITQGMWLPSVRLAYQLTLATSLFDAFGGEPPQGDFLTKASPNTAPSRETLKRWANHCESAFLEHLSTLETPQDLKTARSLQLLEYLMVARLSQDDALLAFERRQICLFVQVIQRAFLYNDLYRATQFFMLRARGSFGLVTVSTLVPSKLVLSSLGQPIVIGVDPQQQYSIYASEPSAVDAVLAHQSETFRIDLNQNKGEIAILSPTHLEIYSMTEKRELHESEIIERRVPYTEHSHQHGYLPPKCPIGNTGIDPIQHDLQDIPCILQSIRESWVNPSSLNRQSAEYLMNLLIPKAKYLAAKQEKLKTLGLDPALAESRHVDLLITGVENSLYVGERFAQDLKTLFPLLSIQVLSSNIVLKKLQHDFESLGLAKQSIVFAISQSGQTFPTLQVLHASDLLVRQGVIREFFILTGETTSFIGSSLARPVYPGENFSRRLFTNQSGRRLSEPATASAAASHHTLTELLFYLTRQMQLTFPGQRPFGLTLSPEGLLVLQGMEDELFLQSAQDILGTNLTGTVYSTRLYQRLRESGKRWALHITEAPWVWAIHALYIVITVGWAIPFGYSIPLAQTLIKILLTALNLPLSLLLPRVILAIAILADIGIYIFGPWFWSLGLRILQKRQCFARTGRRTLVIGDVPWVQKILKNYVSKLFSLSYGITALDIHGADPQDHLVHQFGHRVVRGTLLFFGFPDGRCSAQQHSEETAVLMTARQANGIQHWHTGPEVVAVGSNPMLANQGFADALILPSPMPRSYTEGEQPPLLTNNLVETLRESRFGSFRRLLASYVFFWAFAKQVASFPLLQYNFWRSQSRTKIMTTAAPVSAAGLDRPETEEISIFDLPALVDREQS